jgi:hypothetical protein
MQAPVQHASAELSVMTVERSIPLNATGSTIEVRVESAAAAFSPLTVMLNVDDESDDRRLSVHELRAYDGQSRPYPVPVGQSVQETNGSRVIIDSESLPSGLPGGGGLGIFADLSNGDDARLEVTVVFVSNSSASLSIEIGNQSVLPFDVIQQHYTMDITGNLTGQEIGIDNSFVDPEIHCETCSAVEYRPKASDAIEAAYVTNATDLSLARNLTWWVMGSGDVTFHIAGSRGINGTLSYGEDVAIALDDEWQQVEVDLGGMDLHEVTHPFGFSLAGTEERSFYLKGITVN